MRHSTAHLRLLQLLQSQKLYLRGTELWLFIWDLFNGLQLLQSQHTLAFNGCCYSSIHMNSHLFISALVIPRKRNDAVLGLLYQFPFCPLLYMTYISCTSKRTIAFKFKRFDNIIILLSILDIHTKTMFVFGLKSVKVSLE